MAGSDKKADGKEKKKRQEAERRGQVREVERTKETRSSKSKGTWHKNSRKHQKADANVKRKDKLEENHAHRVPVLTPETRQK